VKYNATYKYSCVTLYEANSLGVGLCKIVQVFEWQSAIMTPPPPRDRTRGRATRAGGCEYLLDFVAHFISHEHFSSVQLVQVLGRYRGIFNKQHRQEVETNRRNKTSRSNKLNEPQPPRL
jgi:hypothetical protein